MKSKVIISFQQLKNFILRMVTRQLPLHRKAPNSQMSKSKTKWTSTSTPCIIKWTVVTIQISHPQIFQVFPVSKKSKRYKKFLISSYEILKSDHEILKSDSKILKHDSEILKSERKILKTEYENLNLTMKFWNLTMKFWNLTMNI